MSLVAATHTHCSAFAIKITGISRSFPDTLQTQGYAYVEFLEVDAVSNAMLLDNTELKGRNIKVRACSRSGQRRA